MEFFVLVFSMKLRKYIWVRRSYRETMTPNDPQLGSQINFDSYHFTFTLY